MQTKQSGVACGVPWCIGLTEEGDQYCAVHKHDQKSRTRTPPPVTRELEQRFAEAMKRDVFDARC